MMNFTINGQPAAFDGDPQMPLLWFLRDEIGLTGTKFGCGMALCGACTVHVDGLPLRSCVTPVSAVVGKNVVTIEAAEKDKIGQIIQTAWVEEQVPQCGYCQSGQIMSAMALLSHKADPSDADIDAAMSGNICRCAAYPRIRAAIHKAAEALKS
ncbi:(2Fe-2S)-binding protein [Gallaecimonas pentaromativorans]|uniref:Isoquinoline 1-oxidoreductase/isoquinoline 1-oxidoreductase alpha subunit n=1 Tax=Gallaecimonas pentaromativorans TaxID=584787 RepID=A0A3N1PN07_9GAMM|nr:(2Fe-2S)-binding protein [Gallaecimonas pentaromativorans]MED5524519.1 (2Fe-2S)-binding protein [Pseudomonadota bacterium]ROQ28531.1 isoquinoline 1-oxidoreductase/isoquinoline 1-oxidoreductase alpha subunit [Gallaecimonas pentaromativorans]